MEFEAPTYSAYAETAKGRLLLVALVDRAYRVRRQDRWETTLRELSERLIPKLRSTPEQTVATAKPPGLIPVAPKDVELVQLPQRKEYIPRTGTLHRINNPTYRISAQAVWQWSTNRPLTWCPRHNLHESPIPQTYAYCPYLDPLTRPGLLKAEETARDNQRMSKRDYSQRGALAKMGLA